MPRKYVTKKLVNKIGTLTNGLFKDSILEVMNCPDATDEQVTDFMGKVRAIGWMRKDMIDIDDDDLKDLLSKKEKIDDIYLSKMVMLNTQDLNDILFLHEHGKPKRAIRTLEVIHSELARRSLLGDSSQSDAIYKNGEVDVKRTSKPSSKTASKKGHKTNKNK